MNITSRVSRLLTAVLAVFIAQFFGYTASAEELTVGGMALAGMGEIELKDINDLIEKQGKAFEEFKKANDDRLKAVESKGFAPADTVEKVEKINTELTQLSKEMAELMKKSNRKNPGTGDEISEEMREHKSAFRTFLRKGDPSGLSDLERKAFRRGSDVDGGYLIDNEMDAEIDRIAGTISVVRSLANVRPIGKAGIEMRVKTSGTAARWVGEGEAGGETDNPHYAKIEIQAEEMEIEPWVYNSTLDDSDYDVYSDLVDEAGVGFGEGEAAAFVSGNGVKKPRGFLTYSNVANANYAWGSVGYIASGASGAFASSNPSDKIIDLLHGLKAGYRNGAVLLMNDNTLAAARKIKDGTGNFYLFNPDATGRFSGFILGAPVQVDDNMPDMDSNSYSIAYANWQRAYRIVDRTGIMLIRDNITTKGTTKFNFRKRTGGGIRNFEAIKLMKFASS
jgi:HK97 family phage major capsid protein